MNQIRFINLLILFVFLFFSCEKTETLPLECTTPPITNPTPPSFSNVPNTEDIIMYEVNLRAFSANGDLQGVINRLNEIKALGVNVIWLMPIHPIGEINSVNSPYSVKNYQEVNPELRTFDDLKQLVEEAHQIDMAVILDWVANHTAWDNPWIANSTW